MRVSRIVTAALCFALVVGFTGCATVGRESMNNANEAKRNNEPAAALMYASEAIKLDPKYSAPKVFLRDNFDALFAQAQSVLKATENAKTSVDAEKRFDTLRDLAFFYENLKKIGMPIAEGKKLFGLIKSWEWQTEILDFSKDLEASRASARIVFLSEGSSALSRGDLDNSSRLFTAATSKFAKSGTEEAAADKKDISSQYAKWAGGFASSRDIDQLLTALKAWDLALRFDAQNTVATEGKAAMRLHLSDVYVAAAERKESERSIKGYEEAIALYQKALSYNASNQKATDGIPRAKESIADIYYTEGVRLANGPKTEANLDKAAESFTQALKWVSGYKDAQLLKNRVLSTKQLVILEAKLASVQSEFDATNKRINYLAELTNKAKKGMDDLNYVADSIVQLDEQLFALSKTLGVLSAIPVIGTVCSITNTALSKVHSPVKTASSKVKRIRAPFITPARNMINTTKEKADSIVSAMSQIRSGIVATRNAAAKVTQALPTLQDAGVVGDIEKEAKTLNGIVDDLASGMKSINSTLDKVEGTMKDVGNSVSAISKVTGGIKTIMSPLNKIKGITDEINGVMKKKIKIPLIGSFTVEQAINSTTGVVKKAAEAILNPVLKKLNISIPSIPGVDELNNILDKVEGYYNDIKYASDQITASATKLLNVPGRMKSTTNSMLAKAGLPPM